MPTGLMERRRNCSSARPSSGARAAAEILASALAGRSGSSMIPAPVFARTAIRAAVDQVTILVSMTRA